MPIINKTKRTAAIYNRGREVVKVYDHGKLAWQKQSFIPDYLCFTALEAGTFTLTIPAAVTPTYLSYVEWSKDGRTWNHTDNTSEAVTIDVQVAQGDKVYWRGSGICMTSTNVSYSSVFSSDAEFDVSGHLLSLLQGNNYTDEALVNYNTSGIRNVTFARLFAGCSKLINAKDLVLPKFSSWYTYILYYTFSNCTNLITAPSLVSTEMSNYCYQGLFLGCSSLLEGKDILATTPATDCCRGMYRECSALTSTGVIGFTTMTENCCAHMFYGCSKINYIKCLATDISANNCLRDWLRGVSSTGTFIQAEGVEWPRGASGIPTGWVDVEKRTMPQGYKQVEYLLNPNYGYININRAFEANAETLEVAFVKQATGQSQPFGNTTYSYRYGSVRVTEQATALAVNVGVDFANQVNKVATIASVSADEPHTLQYVGSSSGFQLYLDGVLKSTQTCAWDAVNPFAYNLVFSAAINASSTHYFHTKPIYYVKIWEGNGVLTLDYVPCIRESDNVAGFYDMAANVFHKSDNANDFTAGEEI